MLPIIRLVVVGGALLLLNTKVSAQSDRESFLEFVVVKGIGFENHFVNYQSQSGPDVDIAYSTGGGMGVQLGTGVFLNKSILLKLDLQYQLTLAGQIEVINGYRTESTARFSRTSLSPGLYYNFFVPDKLLLKGIELGANLEYHIPGGLYITENNTKSEPINFKQTIGYRVRANGIIDLISDRNLFMTFGLGFRGATTYRATLSSQNDLSGSGIDLAIGVRWFMSGQ